MAGRLARLPSSLLLALALAVTGARADPLPPPAAQPEDEPPAEAEEPAAPARPEPAPPPAEPPAAETAPQPTWVDSSHGFLEATLLGPVMRFDRFFSDETELDAERARSFLRWRHELRLEEDGTPSYTTTVRANLRFPALTRALRKLRLVLAAETAEAFDTVFPGETPVEEAPIGTGNAELRLGLWDGLMAAADLGAGVIFELPPGAFGRLRLRWNLPVGTLLLSRIALVGFWRSDEKLGVTTDVNLERPLSRRVLLRLSNGGRLTQVSEGVEWRSELATFVALGASSAVAVGTGVNGASRRRPELDRVRAFARVRRAFHRRWLFFEVEPEIFWPYTPDRGRHTAWALMLRLEVQFKGREPVREPGLPDFPEPRDPPDPAEEPLLRGRP